MGRKGWGGWQRRDTKSRTRCASMIHEDNTSFSTGADESERNVIIDIQMLSN